MITPEQYKIRVRKRTEEDYQSLLKTVERDLELGKTEVELPTASAFNMIKLLDYFKSLKFDVSQEKTGKKALTFRIE